jgi:hypothetical protein
MTKPWLLIKSVNSAVVFLVASLSFPSIFFQSAKAQQVSQSNENIRLVALNIPNFNPSARYNNGTLEVILPQALLAAGIDQVLRANEERIKDTKFQKIDVRNRRFSLIQEEYDFCGNRPNCIPSASQSLRSGFRVTGDWQFQFRELIGCAFGKCHYTSWVSVSGSFSQPLYFRVNNSRLDLQPGGITIRGERWYADAVAPIAGIFDIHGSVKENLRGAIQDFNGMDLRQILIEHGSQEIANQIRVDRHIVSQLISQNVGGINAKVASESLVISLNLPQAFIESSSRCSNNNIEIRPTATNLEFGPGKEWVTCSGYKFVFQNDRNLVLYNPSGSPLWNTGTNNRADLFVVQADGNIVLYGGGTAVWSAGTHNNPGAFLAIQSDGNVVVYSRNGNPIWATNTHGR